MAVIISNVTEGGLADASGIADYEVRVDGGPAIASFRCRRSDDGLAECLRRAADAVDAVRGAVTAPRAYLAEAGEYTLATSGRTVRGVVVECPLPLPDDLNDALVWGAPVAVVRVAT